MLKTKRTFTLAEGTPCYENLTCAARNAKRIVKAPCNENLTCVARRAFTLAEVLIVIGVIGVVAAITIPTLINTISSKAKEAQTEVIEKRLLDGLNRFSTMDDGFSQNYQTTYQFLEGLSKHYKMSAICDSSDIPKCIPYSKINYTTGEEGNQTTESIDVSELTSIEKFMSGDAKDNYLAPAAFISAQGTPFIAAFKKGCVRDTEKAMLEITEDSCLQIMYDKNGTGLPNKLGDDIKGMGLTIIPPAKGPVALATLGGVKIMTTAKVPTPLTKAQCEAEVAKKTEYTAIKNNPGISACNYENDYWAGAMKECKEQGLRLPTEEDLANMANALYTGMQASATDSSGTNKYGTNNASIGSNEPVPDALAGLGGSSGGSSWYTLWSGSEFSSFNAYIRSFSATSSNRFCDSRDFYKFRAVCVGD